MKLDVPNINIYQTQSNTGGVSTCCCSSDNCNNDFDTCKKDPTSGQTKQYGSVVVVLLFTLVAMVLAKWWAKYKDIKIIFLRKKIIYIYIFLFYCTVMVWSRACTFWLANIFTHLIYFIHWVSCFNIW